MIIIKINIIYTSVCIYYITIIKIIHDLIVY